MARCITCNVLYMRQFCRFLYCLAWFDTVEFNRLPCPKNEMHDDAFFANPFHYQLTMFEIRVLIWQSRFFHAHIAYVINTDKIIAAFFRISYCLLDLIRLNSIVCHVQTTRYTMIQISLIDPAINWLFGIRVLIWLSWLLHAHIAYISDGDKIIAVFSRICHCLHDFIRLNSIVGDVQTTRCTMIWFSMFDSDINWLCSKCVYSRGYLDSSILILHMK